MTDPCVYIDGIKPLTNGIDPNYDMFDEEGHCNICMEKTHGFVQRLPCGHNIHTICYFRTCKTDAGSKCPACKIEPDDCYYLIEKFEENKMCNVSIDFENARILHPYFKNPKFLDWITTKVSLNASQSAYFGLRYMNGKPLSECIQIIKQCQTAVTRITYIYQVRNALPRDFVWPDLVTPVFIHTLKNIIHTKVTQPICETIVFMFDFVKERTPIAEYGDLVTGFLSYFAKDLYHEDYIQKMLLHLFNPVLIPNIMQFPLHYALSICATIAPQEGSHERIMSYSKMLQTCDFEEKNSYDFIKAIFYSKSAVDTLVKYMNYVCDYPSFISVVSQYLERSSLLTYTELRNMTYVLSSLVKNINFSKLNKTNVMEFAKQFKRICMFVVKQPTKMELKPHMFDLFEHVFYNILLPNNNTYDICISYLQMANKFVNSQFNDLVHKVYNYKLKPYDYNTLYNITEKNNINSYPSFVYDDCIQMIDYVAETETAAKVVILLDGCVGVRQNIVYCPKILMWLTKEICNTTNYYKLSKFFSFIDQITTQLNYVKQTNQPYTHVQNFASKMLHIILDKLTTRATEEYETIANAAPDTVKESKLHYVTYISRFITEFEQAVCLKPSMIYKWLHLFVHVYKIAVIHKLENTRSHIVSMLLKMVLTKYFTPRVYPSIEMCMNDEKLCTLLYSHNAKNLTRTPLTLLLYFIINGHENHAINAVIEILKYRSNNFNYDYNYYNYSKPLKRFKGYMYCKYKGKTALEWAIEKNMKQLYTMMIDKYIYPALKCLPKST